MTDQGTQTELPGLHTNYKKFAVLACTVGLALLYQLVKKHHATEVPLSTLALEKLNANAINHTLIAAALGEAVRYDICRFIAKNILLCCHIVTNFYIRCWTLLQNDPQNIKLIGDNPIRLSLYKPLEGQYSIQKEDNSYIIFDGKEIIFRYLPEIFPDSFEEHMIDNLGPMIRSMQNSLNLPVPVQPDMDAISKNRLRSIVYNRWNQIDEKSAICHEKGMVTKLGDGFGLHILCPSHDFIQEVLEEVFPEHKIMVDIMAQFLVQNLIPLKNFTSLKLTISKLEEFLTQEFKFCFFELIVPYDIMLIMHNDAKALIGHELGHLYQQRSDRKNKLTKYSQFPSECLKNLLGFSKMTMRCIVELNSDLFGMLFSSPLNMLSGLMQQMEITEKLSINATNSPIDVDKEMQEDEYPSDRERFIMSLKMYEAFRRAGFTFDLEGNLLPPQRLLQEA